MRIAARCTWRRGLVLFVLAGAAVGCGKERDLTVDEGRTHILNAMSVWHEYRKANNNKAPKSMDEFKSWAKKNVKPETLQRMGYKDVDELLTSPRDGQPYELIPPHPAPPGMPSGMAGVAQSVMAEKVGVNGKRFSVTGMGNVMEQDTTP
jgi:hypothetical protein